MPPRKQMGIRRRRKVAKKARLARAVKRQYTPTFTEMVDAGFQTSNTGGIFTVQFDSIPQHDKYAALYRQFVIRKLEVFIIPLFSSNDHNQYLFNAQNNSDVAEAARIAYASIQTANQGNPPNELSVLTTNRSKVRMLTGKPFKITCRPVANLGQQNMGALVLNSAATPKRNLWINTDRTGMTIPHFGVQYWNTQRINGAFSDTSRRVIQVFYKVTFSLKDPL